MRPRPVPDAADLDEHDLERGCVPSPRRTLPRHGGLYVRGLRTLPALSVLLDRRAGRWDLRRSTNSGQFAPQGPTRFALVVPQGFEPHGVGVGQRHQTVSSCRPWAGPRALVRVEVEEPSAAEACNPGASPADTTFRPRPSTSRHPAAHRSCSLSITSAIDAARQQRAQRLQRLRATSAMSS